MNLADIIAAAAGIPVDAAIRLLEAGEKAVPDALPVVEAGKSFIRQAISPANLAAVVAAGGKELGDIFKGQLEGKAHPSDTVPT